MRMLVVMVYFVAGVATAQQDYSGVAGWIDLSYDDNGLLKYYYTDGGWSETGVSMHDRFTLTLKPEHGTIKHLPADGVTISGVVQRHYSEAASGIAFDSAGIFDVRSKTVIGWVICQRWPQYNWPHDRRASCTLEFSGSTRQAGTSAPWYTVHKKFGRKGKLCSLSGTVRRCYECDRDGGFNWHSRRLCD